MSKNNRIDLAQFERDRSEFYDYLETDLYTTIGLLGLVTAYDFQGHVKEAYGNGALTGTQGDYCCLGSCEFQGYRNS